MNIRFIHTLTTFFLLSMLSIFSQNGFAQTGDWKIVTNGGIIHRHECSFANLNDKFILIGGRTGGIDKYTNIYDPATGKWSVGTHKPPMQMHHFQAVPFNNKIYILGAFTDVYPAEKPMQNVYVYDPAADTWTADAAIPADRQRGAAGAILNPSNNKIYVVGGASNGHIGGNVPYLDEFDPATGTWTALTNAPHARDHFQLAIANNKLYVAGGRMSMGHYDANNKFLIDDKYVPEVDVYDFGTGQWTTLPAASNIPTPRAGTAAIVFNNDLLVIGGESTTSGSAGHAHVETEAMSLDNNTWRQMATLDSGRHATHVLMYNNKLYIASGSRANGGSNTSELMSMEEFTPDGVQQNSLSMPSELNFGQVEKDKSKSMDLKITNSSATNSITISNITLAVSGGDFSLTSKPAMPKVLAPGEVLTLNITFDPATLGNRTATLNITHNGENNPSSVSLKGESVLTVTSVDKGKTLNAMIIYPNPTRNTVMIDNAVNPLSWEIHTTTGLKVVSGETDFSAYMQTFDVSNLTPGVYVLTLRDNKENASRSYLLKKE